MYKLVVILLAVLANSACSTTGSQTSQSVFPGNNASNPVSENPAMAAVSASTTDVTIKQQFRADPEWNSVANEVVNCVLAVINKNAVTINDISIYVASLAQASAQAKAFRSMVMTKLVQNGFTVTFEPRKAYHLKYDVVSIENNLSNEPSDNRLIQHDIKHNLDQNLDQEMGVMIRVALVKGDKIITNQSEYKTVSEENSQHIAQFARNL